MVTLPFAFEGRKRQETAKQGLNNLIGKVNTLIAIPNDKLLEIVTKDASLSSAFRLVDSVIRQNVQGIAYFGENAQ